MLFEQWLSSDEDWRKTEIYIETCTKKGMISADARDWVSKTELVGKLGKEGADSMVAYLEKNEPSKCRFHPDAPGVEETHWHFVVLSPKFL